MIRARLSQLPPQTMILHGGARGADTLAGQAAQAVGLPCHVFPAKWNQYGRQAGFIRNIQMLDQKPDLVLAFWDGLSQGTAHTIREALKRGILTETIRL